MVDKNTSNMNILSCPIDLNWEFFISLMDYKNQLFVSNKQSDIYNFYKSFKDVDSLIKWVKERPKGNSRIIEYQGNEEIIVVIPTIDVNGEFAIRCRNEIFKGLHIIFVESGYGNYYFNYAHNCNMGIKKAIEYNPKWIILSNDDMYKIDDINILIEQLKKIDYKNIKTVFTKPSEYHSFYAYLAKNNLFTFNFKITFDFTIWMIRHNFEKLKLILTIRLLYFKFKRYLKINIITPEKYFAQIFNSKIIGNRKFKFINISAFGIFSGKWLKEINGELFDENYINGVEDIDLSINLNKNSYDFDFVDYKIGDLIGQSLGKEELRILKNIINVIYFNKKFEKYKKYI